MGHIRELFIMALLTSALAGCASGAGDRTVNLAYRKAATASSSYDYNLTAQLLTDGILESGEPSWLMVTTAAGELPRREREWTVDGGPYSSNILEGGTNFIEYKWSGRRFSASRVRIVGTLVYTEGAKGWSIDCLAGSGGLNKVGSLSGEDLPGRQRRPVRVSDPNKQTEDITFPARSFRLEIPLDGAEDFDTFRIGFKLDGGVYWEINSVDFTTADSFPPSRGTGPYDSKESRGMNVLPSESFSSTWMSADGDPQWVSVDLGEKHKLARAVIHWIHKAEKAWIETSSDGTSWRKVAEIPEGKGLISELNLRGRRGRFVRLRMEGADGSGRFAITELEVMGPAGASGEASNESSWKLQRASEVAGSGVDISSPGYDASSWMEAVVPGTVLYSYMAAGAVPDPGIADNNLQISESYFNSDFWYRWEVPSDHGAASGRRTLLTFDGINWKAEVFMNGTRLGDIAGAFRRKSFDVTDVLGDKNIVAVRIVKPEHFGAVKEKNAESPDFNGGLLGADNPTFHATVGWDWIPTVRGRDEGIWNDVRLCPSGDVALRKPLVQTRLAEGDTLATMTFSVEVENLSGTEVSGVLEGTIDSIYFSKALSIKGGESRMEVFDPADYPQLRDRRLALWWPNGYGEPTLHPASFRFVPDGEPETEEISFLAGLRQVSYEGLMEDLRIFVNGHRFFPKGGNWGFSEFNLRYGKDEYDTAVRLHKEMNLNMIRNWVGQTGDEEFYDACDKYGIMVWQDFWLANPADGPDPDDEDMFADNAWDYVGRIRSHPSIAIYCGRNEGYPPATLDRRLRETVRSLHGDIEYIPSSADDGVSGHGPYRAVDPDSYFKIPALKFHTERGMPAIMNYGSLRRTMTDAHLWPSDDVWGQHDFTRTGAQGDTAFLGIVRRRYGEKALSSTEEFAAYAQYLNYDGYRAMYEANNVKRKGLLIWMSHSCWPSLAWQTYDYWFDKTAAFAGVAKACEPVHIQINPALRTVQVVNSLPRPVSGLKASIVLTDLSGKEVYRREAQVSAGEDDTVDVFDISDVPDGPVTVDLLLLSQDGAVVSDNRYMRDFKGGDDTGDYRAIVASRPRE